MSTGDVGHFDDAGRLFIDGRDDDMIVSGGENVFPQEVEDLLSSTTRRSRTPPWSASTTRSSASACKAVVVVQRAPHGVGRRGQEVRQGATSPATRCRATSMFVDELPRNATGKVLKRELKEDGNEG